MQAKAKADFAAPKPCVKAGDARQSPQEFFLVLASQLMLPDSEDPPAAGAERARHQTVARPVAGEFLAPEFRVLLRLRGVDRAGVPKATVDEDGEFLFWENEIRPDAKLRLPRMGARRRPTSVPCPLSPVL